MTEEKIQLIIGGLLHDIGKVIYRNGDGRRHSISGYDFLKEEVGLQEHNILESVKYHHIKELKNANIEDDSFAYLTYISDNIAASSDRRKKDAEDTGFEMTAPLEPVFNILNGNKKNYYYHATKLGEENVINEPTENKEKFDEHFYAEVKENIWNNLKGIEWNEEYINSLLAILEANLTYVPSSTAKDELADISLYDHVKLTAAISSCIYDYLEEKKIKNYKSVLMENASDFYKEKAFCLLSMDISGIQQFIYTVYSEGALKMLRARSFYLELMMEHAIDSLLERLNLSRTNLLYAGGGHCYIILANTAETKRIVQEYEIELNKWLLDIFDTDLYVAMGIAECSANDLKNEPNGSYSEIFQTISRELSEKKMHRYGSEQIMYLNHKSYEDHTRECRICKRMGNLNENNECYICEKIAGLSKNILHTDFFAISTTNDENALPMPFGMYLYAEDEKQIRNRMDNDSGFVRVYSKNKFFSGKHIATKIWVGNYTTGETFEELAEQATGIKRIGILRADVDNLGSTFVSGFNNDENQNRYVTISRTATLSRQLSLFFKYHINGILSNPKFTLDNQNKGKRKAAIVYSGGDDLFIVGAWDDIIELSVDIQEAFSRYTENSLTISAGIGLYQPGFPIHVSASETADLEECSKSLPGKNAITILPDGENHNIIVDGKEFKINDGTYRWEEFKNRVILEKYNVISNFFECSESRGKNFLYNLLELIRNQDDKINLARYVYLLTRMEPDEKASQNEKEKYKIFSKNMYQWISERPLECRERNCRELKTAINLYAYRTREKEEK